jgi:hypothetical protein
MHSHEQITSIEQEQIIRQQRRVRKRTHHQVQTNSARKTLQLLEYFMPQNKRIYNFGVKTFKPRPIGTTKTKKISNPNSIQLFQIQVILLDKLKH